MVYTLLFDVELVCVDGRYFWLCNGCFLEGFRVYFLRVGCFKIILYISVDDFHNRVG